MKELLQAKNLYSYSPVSLPNFILRRSLILSNAPDFLKIDLITSEIRPFCHYFATGDLLKKDINAGQQNKKISSDRKPGRPKAIPAEIEPVLIELYHLGYGYRAIARILREDHHVNPDFSTVKRTLKRLGILPHPGFVSKS